MSVYTGAIQNAANSASLADNMYFKELFSILDDSGRDSSGLAALLGYISEMENFVKRAENKITDMKLQLTEMKELQNSPFKAVLQNIIKTLTQKIAEIREERLPYLKSNIAQGCKNAIEAFKDKGIAALDRSASFFFIKEELLSLKESIGYVIRADEKAIGKIEAFAGEYHSATNHLKNMARVAVGKAPIDAKKEAGKLANAIAAPYKAEKAILSGLRKLIDKAVASLGQLEQTAAEKRKHRQAERAAIKKPSLLGRLSENLTFIAQDQREAPIHDRVKTKGAEI